MIIVSNVKSEGIFLFDNMALIRVKEFMDADSNTMYTLAYRRDNNCIGDIGVWDAREKAEAAIDEIVKAYHMGNREVYLK